MNQFNFKSGDIIYWCDQCFEVIENFGNSGIVKQGDFIINKFYWQFQDEVSRLATNEEKKFWGYN